MLIVQQRWTENTPTAVGVPEPYGRLYKPAPAGRAPARHRRSQPWRRAFQLHQGCFHRRYPGLLAFLASTQRLDGRETLAKARESDGDARVLMLGGFGSTPVEVAAVKNATNDYLAKRVEIGPEYPRVSQARSETGWNDPGTDRGVDRSALLKEIVHRKARQLERDVLVRVLRETGGNKAQAARMLQMDYETIHRKLRQYGIHGR